MTAPKVRTTMTVAREERAPAAARGSYGGGSARVHDSDGPLGRSREAPLSPAAVATQSMGGFGGDDGRARRRLRGSAIYTTVRASFGDELL
jgi:hypothetical protein